MRIQQLSIRNLQCLADFELEMAGASVFLIGENGAGKTTVLDAIARSAGQGLRISKADFGDLANPLKIELTLSDLTNAQQGVFADEIDFVQPMTVTLGVRAVWDADQESLDVVHGFPRREWRKTKREQRDAVALEWLPEARDIATMLALGRRGNLIGKLVYALSLEPSVEAAAEGIEAVRRELGQDCALHGLLADVRHHLASIVPEIPKDFFSLGSAALTTQELLSDLELLLAHYGDPLSLQKESSGLRQLVAFAFAMQLVERPGGSILLIDEPETSLHPQAQRALMRALRKLECQTIVATHSSNLLDRADPRTIVRLFRRAGDVVAARPRGLSDDESVRFARFSTPETAEAFFAQGVILVEGDSDKFALEAVAEKVGRNLDGEGITIVSLEGGGGLGTFLGMLGPRGFSLKLAGLCDQDSQSGWIKKLDEAGVGSVLDRAAMERVGFYVCESDLEDELLRALGVDEALEIVQERGDRAAFDFYSQEPRHSDLDTHDQLLGFLR